MSGFVPNVVSGSLATLRGRNGMGHADTITDGSVQRRGSTRFSAVRVARGVILIAAVTAVSFAANFGFLFTGWLFLITIVLQSLDCTFLEAAAVSMGAVASLDYFFIDPLFTLNVDDPRDAIHLASFLVVSLVITRIQSKSRAEAHEARLQRDTMAALYGVGQELLAMAPDAAAGIELLESFRSAFHLSTVCLFDGGTLESHTAGKSSHRLEARTREAHLSGQDMVCSGVPIAVRCLRSAGLVTGAIGFEGLPNPEFTAPALAAFAVTVIERSRAFQSASVASAHAEAETLRCAILDGLAHEFKTPLATILTAAGGLRAAGSMQPNQTELAEMIEVEASRLGDLTSRLMRLARLDRDEVKPRLEPVDAAELVEMSTARYSRIWPDRRISLVKVGESCEIRVDPELIGLALSQLLENACIYSRPESRVEITLSRSGRTLTIGVWSHAAPIPAAERDHIFERFYRGTGADRAAGGSGLGLYVARKIAIAHGGELALVEDGPHAEEGVRFRLTLPVSSGGGPCRD
jgi:two-component system sensor histidine kinase KdpD